MSASEISPALSAAFSFRAWIPWLSGISKSMPAFTAFARSAQAPQSEMTTPSKPHSFRRISVSR